MERNWLNRKFNNQFITCPLRYTPDPNQCVLSFQTVYYSRTQLIQVGVLSPTVDDDDNKCLVDVNGRPRLIECGYATSKRMKLHWLLNKVTSRRKNYPVTIKCQINKSSQINKVKQRIMGIVCIVAVRHFS